MRVNRTAVPILSTASNGDLTLVTDESKKMPRNLKSSINSEYEAPK